MTAIVAVLNRTNTDITDKTDKTSKNNQLHQVDITNGLAELSQNECLPGDKRD